MSGQPQSKGGRLSAGKDYSPKLSGSYWGSTDRASSFWGPVRRLFGFIGRMRLYIYLGVALSMLSSLLAIIGPQFIKQISDMIYDGIVSGSADTSAIASLCILTALLYAVSMVFSTMEHYIVPATSERVANKVRNTLGHKINKLPLNYYDNSSTGDIMSRLTNDADTVGQQCGMSFSLMFSALTTLIGCIILMFYTNPVLGVVAVVPPIAGFVFTRLVIRRTQRYFRAQTKSLGAINGLVEETYYGHPIVKAYGGEKEVRTRFTETNEHLYKVAYRSRFITSTVPQTMAFIGNLGYVLVCIIGSMMVFKGEITYGVIIAFILYVRMFSTPLILISDAFAGMQSLAASAERVFELMDAPEMEDESSKDIELPSVKGEVEFRDVCFSYIEGTEVIHDFSLRVEPGEKVAIVGPTGSTTSP